MKTSFPIFGYSYRFFLTLKTPPLVTICIPWAEYHSKLVERAVDSAYRQTIPCIVRTRRDAYGYGAGDNRNALLSKVETPLLTYLDADDVLEPTFVEECLRAIRPGTYVYTDYFEDHVYTRAPVCDEWIGGGATHRMHLVTTLLPTAVARHVKGFDPYLPGAEDTDFYLKIRHAGICPIHVRKALLHYSRDGQRSELWKQHPDKIKILTMLWQAYGGDILGCGCNQTPGNSPQGGKMEGDVIAETLYEPSKEFGLDGRFYPRQMYKGAKMWVSRQDIMQWPDKWRMVDDPEHIAPDVDKVAQLALEGLEEVI